MVQRKKSFAGWYITRTHIYMVLVEQRDKQFQVILSLKKSLPSNNGELIGTVIKNIIFEELKGDIPRKNVLVFPLEDLYQEEIMIPLKNESAMIKMLYFEINKLVLSPETMKFFATRMSVNNRMVLFKVFGMRKKLFEETSSLFKKSSQHHICFCIGEDAYLGAYEYFSNKQERKNALLTIRKKSMNIVYRDEESLLSREYVGEEKNSKINDFLKQFISSLHEKNRSNIKKLIVSGDKSYLGAVKDSCSAMGLSAEPGYVTEVMLQECFFPAFGGILKSFSQRKEPIFYRSITNSERDMVVLNKIRFLFRVFIFCGIFVLLGQLYWFFDIRQLDKQVTRVLTSFSNKYGKNHLSKNPVLQMERYFQDNLLSYSLHQEQIKYLPEILIALDKSLHEGKEVTIKVLRFSHKELILDGVSTHLDLLQSWKARLHAIVFFSSVDFITIQRNESSNNVHFSLKIYLKDL
ncbi:hypothetical protein ACFL1T_00670 [Chlamydiota bacterium]